MNAPTPSPKPIITTRLPWIAAAARKVFGKTAIVVKLPAFRL